jgi:FkbM family methyltransferase
MKMISEILRHLPPFKGKQRLSRLLLQDFIAKSRDLLIVGRQECIYKLPNAKETVGFEILINGVYEKATIDFIVNRLPANKIFLDLGANIGAISIPVCKQRYDTHLICVEAAPWLFEYLASNIAANSIQNATLINKAVSDVSGKKASFYSPVDKFGKGSLAPVFTSEGVDVETITLGDLVASTSIEDLGFIKIDIEGFEYFAFLGGRAILKEEHAPDMLFEFADWAEDLAPNINAGAAQTLLFDYGYNVYLFKDGKIGDKLKEPRSKGSSMMFATKRPL